MLTKQLESMETKLDTVAIETARLVDLRNNVLDELDEAERKAIDALSRYKFQMFGYWAAIWVHLNRLSGEKRPSPFKSLVNNARIQNAGYGR